MNAKTTIRNRFLRRFSAALLACTALRAPALAAQLNVPSQYPTIQAAINAASQGDEVVVADGTYQGPGFENIDFNGKAITVRSVNGAANCILSYESTTRAFHFHSGEGAHSVVSGFTIRFASAGQGDGGAIFCDNASPTITDCIFMDNIAANGSGGAIAGINSDTAIRYCHFDGNVAQFGGAIAADGGSPTLESCTFEDNQASDGGGVASFNATVAIGSCTFLGNAASNIGGAVMNDHSQSTFRNCRFELNTGTAVFNYGGRVNVGRCDFINNSGSIWGGAVFSRQGAYVTLDGCQFRGNSATNGGAVMTIGPYSALPTEVIISDCHFQRNAADDSGGAVYNWEFAISTIRQCEFLANTASNEGGGAIFIGRSSDVNVGNCYFAGNSAVRGGAVTNQEEDQFPGEPFHPLIVNCVFTGNRAIFGGGVHNDRIEPRIANCSFSANRGGALYSTSSTSVSVFNSIFWNHPNPIIGGNPSVTYSDVQGGFPGTGNINADPRFVDHDGPDNVIGTDDDNLRLRPLSPCLDAGRNSAIPADLLDLDRDGDTSEPTPVDLDLNPRIVNLRVDMGAYERQ